MISKRDFEKVSRYKWRYHLTKKTGRTGYVVRTVRIKGVPRDKQNKMVYMHRFIMDVTDSKIQVDHKNSNGLDNRRSNLRVCSNQKNCFSSRGHRNSSSRYKGVSFYKRDGTFEAYITVDGKRRYLGRYALENDAARAYNKVAKKLHGEFVRLNVIKSGGTSNVKV